MFAKPLAAAMMTAALASAAFASSTAALAQVSDDVVKIGVLSDMSGLYSDLGGEGSTAAAAMAVEDYKAAAKGMKVEIISADHQNKPDVGSQIASRWYDVDKVDVIVDVPTSSVALAVRKIAQEKGMIEPFVDSQKRDGIISYGLSSYGYDARVGTEFKIFTNVDSAVVDPKNFAANSFVDRTGDVCIIPPNSFALARTVEYFRIPRDVLVVCVGKSTYARCGIIVNVTPLEPEWEGHVTLEFSNTTPLPAKIYANEGACQFLFLQGDQACETSYRDKAGKYQGQRGVTLPKI